MWLKRTNSLVSGFILSLIWLKLMKSIGFGFILILTGLVSGFIFVFFGLELMIGLVSGFLLSMTEIFSRVNPKSYLGYHNYVEIWCDNDSTSLNRSY